jgi:hypothetical protein
MSFEDRIGLFDYTLHLGMVRPSPDDFDASGVRKVLKVALEFGPIIALPTNLLVKEISEEKLLALNIHFHGHKI